jgi:hypothetical protein
VIAANLGEFRPLFGKKINGVALDPPAQLKNVAYSQIRLPFLILKHHLKLCLGEQSGPLQHFPERSGFRLSWHS